MAERRNWTWEETLVAFRLYCCTPFGKLDQRNPDIITLAKMLDRTPSAVGMKACNFASLDPLHQQRGVVGLRNRSQLEVRLWEQFNQDSEAVAAEAEAAYERLTASEIPEEKPQPLDLPEGPSEVMREVRVRRVQSFFRNAVLTSYGHRCALTGLSIPGLLNASHIIPWAKSPQRRADPTNGICLNVLHDRAFDRGLISFDANMCVLVSPRVEDDQLGHVRPLIAEMHGRPLRLPDRFSPSLDALAYHRAQYFNH